MNVVGSRRVARLPLRCPESLSARVKFFSVANSAGGLVWLLGGTTAGVILFLGLRRLAEAVEGLLNPMEVGLACHPPPSVC
jgi:hypothetical protein